MSIKVYQQTVQVKLTEKKWEVVTWNGLVCSQSPSRLVVWEVGNPPSNSWHLVLGDAIFTYVTWLIFE